MKTKLLSFFLILIMSVTSVVFISCGGDDDEDTPNLYEMIAGNSFKITQGTVYFYKNGMVMLEVSNGGISPGQLTYNDNRAIGTWSIQGDKLVTDIRATNMEMDYVRRVLPSPVTIEKNENGYWCAQNKEKLFSMVIFGGTDLHDNSNTKSADNAILGKWTGQLYLNSSTGSKEITVKMEFKEDNIMRTIEDEVLKLDVTNSFNTSLGLLSLEKFLGSESASFYYTVEKGMLFFYDSKTADVSFRWKRQ